MRILFPNKIREDSWIMTDPRFEWFKEGYYYAMTQTRAIPALAKVDPEELFFAVSAILRGVKLAGKELPKDMLIKTFVIDGETFFESREGLTAEKIVALRGRSLEGVRAVRQYFVDGERQRYWPVGWNEEIDSLESGDKFVIEMGERIQRSV